MSPKPSESGRTVVLEVRRKRTTCTTAPRAETKVLLGVMLTPYAETRLSAPYLSASAENPVLADLWLRTLREKILELSQVADAHPIAEESWLFGHEIRELTLDDASLRILFRIGKASLQVLDVYPR